MSTKPILLRGIGFFVVSLVLYIARPFKTTRKGSSYKKIMIIFNFNTIQLKAQFY